MKEVLKDIQSGKFTKEWMQEHKSGQKNFLRMRDELAKHQIESRKRVKSDDALDWQK